MQRACDICGSRFEARRVTARYCSGTCRKRAQRVGKADGAGPDLAVLPAPGERATEVGDLVASTERALREAQRLDSWLGQSAVELARRIERATADTGSAYASLHRELRAAMTEALRGANQETSVVQRRRDELAERRRKAQGA